MAGAQALAGELPGAVLQGAAALGGGSGMEGGGSGVEGGGVGDGIGGEGGGHGGYPFGWEEMHRGLKATANLICGELAGFGNEEAPRTPGWGMRGAVFRLTASG